MSVCVAQAVGHTTDTASSVTSAILTGKVVRPVVLEIIGRLGVLSSLKHFDFCQQLGVPAGETFWHFNSIVISSIGVEAGRGDSMCTFVEVSS